LRQIAIAVGSFEASHQHLPSGGWSKNWAGVPSLGAGPAQPGGWIYQLLPYLDQAELFSSGANPATLSNDPKLLESPIPILFCPSRRKGRALDNSRDWQPHLFARPTVVARNDYAMNGGDNLVTYGEGPESIAQAKSFAWPSMKEATGVVFQRSWLRGSEITDGRSNVYLVGEKYLFTDHYRDGGDWGDNECAYSGDDRDLVRFTGITRYAPLLPLSDTFFDGRTLGDSGVRFGGPHRGIVQMAYADSSVRTVSFDVDLDVHQQLGNRRDGLPMASQSRE
jgi:hypothetical protein